MFSIHGGHVFERIWHGEQEDVHAVFLNVPVPLAKPALIAKWNIGIVALIRAGVSTTRASQLRQICPEDCPHVPVQAPSISVSEEIFPRRVLQEPTRGYMPTRTT